MQKHKGTEEGWEVQKDTGQSQYYTIKKICLNFKAAKHLKVGKRATKTVKVYRLKKQLVEHFVPNYWKVN